MNHKPPALRYPYHSSHTLHLNCKQGRQLVSQLDTPKLQRLQFHAPYKQLRPPEVEETTRPPSSNQRCRAAMSTDSRARQVGGVRQFPVGRRRYVPVVDAGCGCRRPRLFSLPSFLKSSGSCRRLGGGKAGMKSGGSPYWSSTSSPSSCAATQDYYYHGGAGAAATKQEEKQAKKKKRQQDSKTMGDREAGDGVGVAVEKDSCDPRADFRESMVQMVLEMGLCDWDGLRSMLRRLLALNAPHHHAAILTAFADVCAQIVAAPSSPPPARRTTTSTGADDGDSTVGVPSGAGS
jgi:uncharacterized protein (TIGR01568 family)